MTSFVFTQTIYIGTRETGNHGITYPYGYKEMQFKTV